MPKLPKASLCRKLIQPEDYLRTRPRPCTTTPEHRPPSQAVPRVACRAEAACGPHLVLYSCTILRSRTTSCTEVGRLPGLAHQHWVASVLRAQQAYATTGARHSRAVNQRHVCISKAASS